MGNTASWAADMAIAITSPSGECISFGGYNDSPDGCPSLGNYEVVWPTTWAVSTNGSYATTVDISEANLSGSGDWSVVLHNGYGASAGTSYQVNWVIPDLCPDDSNVNGCTDETACNYDENATNNDDSCNYAAEGLDCLGNCLNDQDDDGVCDELEVAGCTDANACNYSDAATDEDGSCTFADAGYDCDGNCILDLDNDGAPDCETEPCPEDLNGNGMIEVSDVLLLLGDFGCTANCAADIDEDGAVGVTDVLLLLAAYGEEC